MTGKLHQTLTGQTFARPAIWLMRQAGRYLPEYLETRKKAGSFLDLCYNPSLATEVTMQPIRRFGFDAAILFSDILVVPHALGQPLDFLADHGPVLGDLPNFNDGASQDLSQFHVNLSPVYEAVSSIRNELDSEGFKDTDLIGFSGSPWTLACYMIEKKGSKDFAKTRSSALSDPQQFSFLIDLLTQAVSSYLVRQIESGANIIQLFDSWAGVLSPDQFRKWVIGPTAKIVANIRKKHPQTPIIGFPRGAAFLYQDYIRQTGVTALGMDTQVPPEYACENLQTLCPVQGNLDPMVLRAGGKELDLQTAHILEALGRKPFIFNLGHGIDKETPIAHVENLVKRIRS